MAGPIQPQKCSLKKIKFFGIIFILITLIATASCTTRSQTKVTLITGGYGYEVGDIVLIDTKKEPELGDVVQYDWGLNKSNCFAFGPSMYLSKIIGLPGDTVSFNVTSFSANGYTGSFPNGQLTKPMMWGNYKIYRCSKYETHRARC